jgi:HSP20 family protein
MNIWNEMRKMQEQMDALFSDFFNEPKNNLLLENTHNINNSNAITNYKKPSSDITETDKEVILEVDLPGVDKKDIKINISKDNVEIKAEKKDKKSKEDKKGLYRLERSYIGYHRKYSLPSEIDFDNSDAEYIDGVLKITMPKKEIKSEDKKRLTVK